jgi:hypothetical protein
MEKARARKAQAGNKVDALAQLEVGEGDKKTRKGIVMLGLASQ